MLDTGDDREGVGPLRGEESCGPSPCHREEVGSAYDEVVAWTCCGAPYFAYFACLAWRRDASASCAASNVEVEEVDGDSQCFWDRTLVQDQGVDFLEDRLPS